jgi:hypothetical protein
VIIAGVGMNQKKIIIYVCSAYGISWLIWLPNVLYRQFDIGKGADLQKADLQPNVLYRQFDIGSYSLGLHILGPFLGAVITAFILGKGIGVKKFF